MKRINQLVFRAIIPPFLISLTILTSLVFIYDFGRLSSLLISKNASLGVILKLCAVIVPGILIFSLPLAFLIGILTGISGLCGEHQIIALRACGIPVRRLLPFMMWAGILVAICIAVLSMVVLPKSNNILQEVKGRISLSHAASQVQARVFNEIFPNIVFYVADFKSDRQTWENVFIVDNSDPKAPKTIVARRGTWISTGESPRIQIHLKEGASYTTDPLDPSKDSLTYFAATDIPIDLTESIKAYEDYRKLPLKVAEQSTLDLWKAINTKQGSLKVEAIIEFNRRISLPFSIFPFIFLGLSLSAARIRSGRTWGFALSLVSVLSFYILFFNGIRLASVGKINPWLGVWGANILFAIAGTTLLLIGEQNFRLAYWLEFWIDRAGLLRPMAKLGIRQAVNQILAADRLIARIAGNLSKLFFPKVVDLYIARGFLGYFFWCFIACGTLFVLLTLFDLLDDIVRNRIALAIVLDYFTFLTPQIIVLIVPISVLLAVLINFGIMEKHSEITAMKAGGWSLYRLSLPTFLLGSTLCLGLFLTQDYILPYANDHQDSLRNVIKGKPPQTTMRMQRKWIFGESSRIYNYEYFDGSQDSFVDLNIYEVDLNSVKILRRIHAAQARIISDGKWLLEDGWMRDFNSKPGSFRRIQHEIFNFPEKAGYFEKEIFQPKESSKLTYRELRNYINYLRESGYNALELQVELNKKISFPLSCIIMILIAVPFSFSMGKKGAFYGIGISIAIAIGYWTIAGVFDAMGAYGHLAPFLAAWAPNILFGAAGLILLLNMRT